MHTRQRPLHQHSDLLVLESGETEKANTVVDTVGTNCKHPEIDISPLQLTICLIPVVDEGLV